MAEIRGNGVKTTDGLTTRQQLFLFITTAVIIIQICIVAVNTRIKDMGMEIFGAMYSQIGAYQKT